MENSCLNLVLGKVTARPATLIIAVFRGDWPNLSSVFQTAKGPGTQTTQYGVHGEVSKSSSSSSSRS
jgi:hypothetical protein